MRLFIDSASVLKWSQNGCGIEPRHRVIEGLRLFAAAHPRIDIFAFFAEDIGADALPFISPSHRLEHVRGVWSYRLAPGGVKSDDYLISADARDLACWVAHGGKGIRLDNCGDDGQIWPSRMIRSDDEPEHICQELSRFMGICARRQPSYMRCVLQAGGVCVQALADIAGLLDGETITVCIHPVQSLCKERAHPHPSN